MDAIALEAHGGPERLALGPVPDARAAAGEVLVELRAAAVNRRDLLLRAGATPAYRPPLPLILGSDGAGVRRDTGEAVMILPSLHWGPSETAPGSGFRTVGGPGDGTYAELVAVPAENLFPKPDHLSWAEAAALPLAALTAHRALFTIGELRSGERLVVLGAGGGVSLAAIQLAVQAGAKVAVTSSSAAKLALAAELGASAGVDYTRDGWAQELAQEIGAADVVLDSVGSTWADALGLLAPGGRLVSCGSTRAAVAEVDIRAIYVRQLSIRGSLMGSPRDFAALLERVAAGRIVPVVDSVRPLADAAAAHARIERGEQRGKLVLAIS